MFLIFGVSVFFRALVCGGPLGSFACVVRLVFDLFLVTLLCVLSPCCWCFVVFCGGFVSGDLAEFVKRGVCPFWRGHTHAFLRRFLFVGLPRCLVAFFLVCRVVGLVAAAFLGGVFGGRSCMIVVWLCVVFVGGDLVLVMVFLVSGLWWL